MKRRNADGVVYTADRNGIFIYAIGYHQPIKEFCPHCRTSHRATPNGQKRRKPYCCYRNWVTDRRAWTEKEREDWRLQALKDTPGLRLTSIDFDASRLN